MEHHRSACLQRSLSSGAAAALSVGLVAGCSSPPPVHVTVPDGPGRACAALQERLPDDVDGRSSRDTTPSSVRTAAWGDPAVELRCGVARPAALTATSELVEVDGVDWFLSERGSAYVFTSTGRGTYVEVRVPSSVDRSAATAPLVDLAGAVKQTLPTTGTL